MENSILLLLLLVPLIISLINVFIPRIASEILTFLGIAFNLILVYFLFHIALSDVVFFGVTIFSIDMMGIFVITFIQILSFLILIFSLKGVEREI